MATSSNVTDICSKKHHRLSTLCLTLAEHLCPNPAAVGQGPGSTGGSGIPRAALGELGAPRAREGPGQRGGGCTASPHSRVTGAAPDPHLAAAARSPPVPLALGGETEAHTKSDRQDAAGMLRRPQEGPLPSPAAPAQHGQTVPAKHSTAVSTAGQKLTHLPAAAFPCPPRPSNLLPPAPTAGTAKGGPGSSVAASAREPARRRCSTGGVVLPPARPRPAPLGSDRFGGRLLPRAPGGDAVPLPNLACWRKAAAEPCGFFTARLFASTSYPDLTASSESPPLIES